MARTTIPRSTLPLDSWTGHRRSMTRKPTHEQYESMQQFFNEKRLQLLQSLPPTFSFNRRVIPETRGELINPSPQGSPRQVLTEETAQLQRSKNFAREGRKQSTPQYHLARRQLKNMWNAKLTTEEQEIEREQATPKMRASCKTYRLKISSPRREETQIENKAAKNVAEQKGVDEEEGVSPKEKTAAGAGPCLYDEHIRDDIEEARAMVQADVGRERRSSKRKRSAMDDDVDIGNEE